MTCVFEVEAFEGHEVKPSDLRVFHTGCGSGVANIHRDPATDEYRLRCDCGFEVVFKNGGVGISKIVKTAITGEPQVLLSDDYFQCGADSIVVNARSQPAKETGI